MLNVQEYLSNHSLKELEDNHGVINRVYDDKVVLNYSQIDSRKFNHISDECRGLILSLPDYNILCRSFDRFYNHFEGNCGDYFDLKNSIIFDKIDGSLINFYYDGNNWQCATRGTAYAEGPTNLGNEFRKAVERALGFKVEKFNRILPEEIRNYTIITEFVSPESRVTVKYKEYKIYILAIRNKYTGEYLPNDDCFDVGNKYFADKGANVDYPKSYRFSNFNDLIKIVENLDPFCEEGEGYVCYNPYEQTRMKVKNPKHTAIANMRENGIISQKRIAILVFSQDHEEYLGYFPEDREYFEPYINAYDRMINQIYEVWEKTKDIETQKDFALQVKDLPIGFVLFGFRQGKNLADIFNNVNYKKKFELMERYKE